MRTFPVERALIQLSGGVSHVARVAGVAQSNLSAWLNGRSHVSDDTIARILEAVGLPHGVPKTGTVHFWKAGSATETLDKAVSRLNAVIPIFFPLGAELAEVATPAMAIPLFRPLSARLYALRGPGPDPVRAVIRCALRPIHSEEPSSELEFGPQVLAKVTWKNNVNRMQIIVPDLRPWLESGIDVTAFDAAWKTRPRKKMPAKERPKIRMGKEEEPRGQIKDLYRLWSRAVNYAATKGYSPDDLVRWVDRSTSEHTENDENSAPH